MDTSMSSKHCASEGKVSGCFCCNSSCQAGVQRGLQGPCHPSQPRDHVALRVSLSPGVLSKPGLSTLWPTPCDPHCPPSRGSFSPWDPLSSPTKLGSLSYLPLYIIHGFPSTSFSSQRLDTFQAHPASSLPASQRLEGAPLADMPLVVTLQCSAAPFSDWGHYHPSCH